MHWLEQGAPYEGPPPLPSDVAQTVLDENTSTVVPGFIGAYPNALYAVPRANVAEFTAAVGALSSEADMPAAVAPATAAVPPAESGAGAVAMYQTDNCSGEGTKVAASTSKLPDGYLSFQGESGSSIQTWQKPGFGGESTQPVAPGICVSPGWPIASVKIDK